MLVPDAGVVRFGIGTPTGVWLALPKLLGEASALKFFGFCFSFNWFYAGSGSGCLLWGEGLNEAAIIREVGFLLSPERAVEKKINLCRTEQNPGAEEKGRWGWHSFSFSS